MNILGAKVVQMRSDAHLILRFTAKFEHVFGSTFQITQLILTQHYISLLLWIRSSRPIIAYRFVSIEDILLEVTHRLANVKLYSATHRPQLCS